jgi:hypothetical protein
LVLERKKELEKQKLQAVQQKLEKRPLDSSQEILKKKAMLPSILPPKTTAAKSVSTIPKPTTFKPVLIYN